MTIEQVEKLLNEFGELKLKQIKLKRFLSNVWSGSGKVGTSDDFVTPAEYERLEAQHNIMIQYLDILKNRIESL